LSASPSGAILRLLDPSIYLGNVETGKSKEKTLATAEADHRSGSNSQGRPSGAASVGLTLGGESEGKVFCCEDAETRGACCFFPLAAAFVFNKLPYSNHAALYSGGNFVSR
jgi:hypothetical protein